MRLAKNLGMKAECPHCEGKTGWEKLTTPEWIEPPVHKWTTCWTCDGKGEVDELKAAIYKARGGPEPIRFRGFA